MRVRPAFKNFPSSLFCDLSRFVKIIAEKLTFDVLKMLLKFTPLLIPVYRSSESLKPGLKETHTRTTAL